MRPSPIPVAAAPRVGAVGAVGAAWLLSVAFDLFLHAGLLARLYARAGPALLAADQAFARIPLGYAAFLVLTAALGWLLRRLEIRGALSAARFGLLAGLVIWGALALGLYSITLLEGPMLLGWWIGQAAELALAGAVLGAASAGMARARLFRRVAAAVFFLVAATVALQVLGLAPPMRTVGSG